MTTEAFSPSATARLLAPAARENLPELAAALGLVVLRVGAVLARPWPLALAVDVALSDTVPESLPIWLADLVTSWSPATLLVVAAIAGATLSGLLGLLDMAVDRAAEGAAERVGGRLRQQAFHRAMTRSLRWHDRLRSGELVSRITSDTGRLLDALVAVSTRLLPDLLMLVVVLSLIAGMDLQLAAVAVGILPLLALLATDQRRRVRSSQLAARHESGRLVRTANDLLRNVRAVQAFGRFDRADQAFATRNRAVLDADLRSVAVAARWTPVSEVVLGVGAGLVLVIGGTHVLSGSLSVGGLLVVTAYLRDLYAPVRGLTRLSAVMAKAGVSAARLAEVLRSTEAVRDRVGAVALHDTGPVGLRMERVDFAYERGRPVLDGADLDVAPGETVALVGPSGGGKSTVLALLLRLYDIDGGRVLVAGVDVRHWTLNSLRRAIGYLPQDPWLLDLTLAENIAMGSPNASRAQVERAGRLAQLDDVVSALPQGWDTVLGEGGVRLSGGQRRRVALARAVLSGAPVLLLDEPTASLDPDSVDAVLAAIEAASAGRTVLVVTHDDRLARRADRCVTLHPHDDRPEPSGRRVTAPRRHRTTSLQLTERR